MTDDEESSAALVERVRQFPGQEKAVWDYYRNNADALASVRAPLYEEKVSVDHVLGKAKVTDKPVSKEELLKQDDEAACSRCLSPGGGLSEAANRDYVGD